MSFHLKAKHARDAGRTLASRHCAFRSCVQLYRWLIRAGFRETYRRFADAYGLAELSDDRLRSAMDALEVERERFLDRMRAYARRRVEEKHRGRRAADPSVFAAAFRRDFFVTGD